MNSPSIPTHLVDRLGWVLMHSLWQFALLGILALGLAHAMRRYSARARYVTLLAVFALLAAAPLATWFLLPLNEPDHVAEWEPHHPTEAVVQVGTQTFSQAPERRTVESVGDIGSPKRAAPWWSTATEQIRPWLPMMVCGWCAGVLMFSVRPLLSWRTVRRLRTIGLSAAPNVLHQALDSVARRLELSWTVRIAQSELVSGPVVVGYFRPVILLPISVVTGLPASQLAAILAHELAHVRRHDYVVNVLQTLVETVFFYHPAVWWLSSRIRIERENCCDDLAVAAVGDRVEYGRALLAVEEQRGTCTTLALEAKGGSLSARVQRLFEGRSPHTAGSSWWMCCLLAVFIGFAVWLVLLNEDRPASANRPQTKSATKANVSQKKDEYKNESEEEKSMREVPITVSGRALDPQGKPIQGARIFIVSLRGLQKMLAEVKTDMQGRYRFKDVPLPVQRGDRPNARDAGGFEVFGMAKGFGFTWRPSKVYFPEVDGSGNTPGAVEKGDLPRSFVADEPIELDLRFSRAARLSGRIVDDRGVPIAGAKVSLWNAEPTPKGGYDHANGFLTVGPWSFDSLYLAEVMPTEIRNRFTDAAGRFAFDNTPKNTEFRLQVNPPNFTRRMVYATTADLAKFHFDDPKIHVDDMELVFDRPRTMPLEVVYADTSKPAKNVFVNLYAQAGSAWSISDEQGKLQLRLPPGEYRCGILPEHGTPYLGTGDQGFGDLGTRDLKYSIPAHGKPIAPLVIRLERAAELEAVILDADTKHPIEGVDLFVWFRGSRAQYNRRTWKPPNLSYNDEPHSDKNGKLRAVFKPGDYEIGPGHSYIPIGYQWNTSKARVPLKARAGKLHKVTLLLPPEQPARKDPNRDP